MRENKERIDALERRVDRLERHTDAPTHKYRTDGGTTEEPPDDLETEYALVLRGKKADLAELHNVLHQGHHAKMRKGDYTPPDFRMIGNLLSVTADLLEIEAIHEAMAERFEEQTGPPIVGEAIAAELIPPDQLEILEEADDA